MSHKLKGLLFLVAFASCATALSESSGSCCDSSNACCGCTQSQNLWQPHAFSQSMAREIMLQKDAWASAEPKEGWHGTFGVSGEYWQNWGEGSSCNSCSSSTVTCCKSIGSIPLWSTDQSNQITIGDNSGNYDLDGYQLGLGPLENGGSENNGTMSLSPKVYQAGGDMLLYVGSHQTQRGFFAKINGPVGVIKVNPRLSYSKTITSQAYPVGTFTQAATTTAPYENIQQSFASGENAGSFYKQMLYGLIDCAQSSGAKFGDLGISLGYNLFADEKGHMGVALRFTAPTGNKAKGIYVLEPIFGRNGHWGVGGEIIGHYKLWESDECNRYVNFWFDGIAEHLFNSKHCRTFDLKGNGLGSKYLLVAKYSDAATGATFQNEIINAVNITRLQVQSTFAVEGDFALGFDFHHEGWNFMIGYEGWGRSCEKLSLDCSCATTVNFSQYAVLGRQAPYGQTDNLCQPTATIGESVDRAAAAGEFVKDATNSANRLPATAGEALDICAQQAHATYTSKVFAQLGYTWTESDYVPFVALTGGAEFNNRYNNAANFWNVGLQGGLAF